MCVARVLVSSKPAAPLHSLELGGGGGGVGLDGMWGNVVLLFSQWTCVVGSGMGVYADRGV